MIILVDENVEKEYIWSKFKSMNLFQLSTTEIEHFVRLQNLLTAIVNKQYKTDWKYIVLEIALYQRCFFVGYYSEMNEKTTTKHIIVLFGMNVLLLFSVFPEEFRNVIFFFLLDPIFKFIQAYQNIFWDGEYLIW